jgi:uncharacterized membrane protein
MEMFTDGFTLLIQGKLLRDYPKVFAEALLGAFIGMIIFIVLAFFSVPLWIAVIVSSAISGALQPWIFKDIKFA